MQKNDERDIYLSEGRKVLRKGINNLSNVRVLAMKGTTAHVQKKKNKIQTLFSLNWEHYTQTGKR